MKRKYILKMLALMLVTTCVLSGCSKSDSDEPSKTGLGLPSLTGGDTPTDSTVPADSTTEGSTRFSAETTGDYIAEQEALRKKVVDNADYYNSIDLSGRMEWCFVRKDDHTPSGTWEQFDITEYNALYIDKMVSEKVVYLTFDCGFPSTRTVSILDTLAKHDIKANFFVTKMYLEDCSEYCKRMVEEGHLVCNHSVHHTVMTDMTVEEIAAEIIDVAEFYYEKTGYTLAPYFRPPTGAYDKRLLTITDDLGYKTVFWSLAYGDYDQNNQPTVDEVIDHFHKYHHNGAIILMHNDSSANEAALDDVLTYMESQGYRFALLDELE